MIFNMKFIKTIVFVLISLAVSGRCFILQQNQTDKISKFEKGDSICIENVPYQVMIKFDGSYICGGALIEQNLVLTAAHCIRKSKLSVVAGTDSTELYFGHTFFDGSIEVAAKYIVIHPEYHERSPYAANDNDLALIKLAKEFPITNRIKAISLPFQNVKLNEELTLAGTGRLDSHTKSSCLQFYKPRVVDCSLYGISIRRGDDIFCHKGEFGKRARKGDSGSPMVNSRNELVGIHTGTAKHSVQISINVYYYLDWIFETIYGRLSNEI